MVDKLIRKDLQYAIATADRELDNSAHSEGYKEGLRLALSITESRMKQAGKKLD